MKLRLWEEIELAQNKVREVILLCQDMDEFQALWQSLQALLLSIKPTSFTSSMKGQRRIFPSDSQR
jgi:hypothetical protein